MLNGILVFVNLFLFLMFMFFFSHSHTSILVFGLEIIVKIVNN